jgi:hypothetical protein
MWRNSSRISVDERTRAAKRGSVGNRGQRGSRANRLGSRRWRYLQSSRTTASSIDTLMDFRFGCLASQSKMVFSMRHLRRRRVVDERKRSKLWSMNAARQYL